MKIFFSATNLQDKSVQRLDLSTSTTICLLVKTVVSDKMVASFLGLTYRNLEPKTE